MKYHNNIDRFRKAAGLTVEELAKNSGISRGYLNEIKRGDKPPTLDVLANIAKALGTTASKLIEENSSVVKVGVPQSENLRNVDIAIIDALKDVLVVLTDSKIVSKERLEELFSYQRDGYQKKRMPGAPEVMKMLLDYVADKPPESEFQAMLKLLRHAPAGSA